MGLLLAAVGHGKAHLCEGGQPQFPSAKTISPSESTGLQGYCALLLKGSKGEGSCGIL